MTDRPRILYQPNEYCMNTIENLKKVPSNIMIRIENWCQIRVNLPAPSELTRSEWTFGQNGCPKVYFFEIKSFYIEINQS